MSDSHDVYDSQGDLVSSTPIPVSDEEVQRRQAADNLRQSYNGLRTWASDAQATYDAAVAASRSLTAGEQREFLRRFGVLCNRLADLLQASSLK